jgi:hypothetical protein
MEIETVIGSKLSEIQKKSDGIRLVFTKTNHQYELFFNGLLFETPYPTINKKVRMAKLNRVLGFKATTQLRREHKNPKDYKQLYIQMEGSDDENKIELVAALKDYDLHFI